MRECGVTHVDERQLASESLLRQWCARVCGAGYRGTGTAVHEGLIDWVVEQAGEIPGFAVRTDEYELLGWHPLPEGDLEHAGVLRNGDEEIAVAGAVPYSLPTTTTGLLAYVPRGEPISEALAGKVVLRDFPAFALPYDLLFAQHIHLTPDTEKLRGQVWDRPGLANTVLHDDLLAAGAAGTAGVVFAFDVPRAQIAGYYEPHMGTHYRVPAVFVGVDERDRLRGLAEQGAAEVQMTVRADVHPVTTRNVHATLAGQTDERIVLITHTDGNTWVQENGIAALLAVGHYAATLPIEQRRRTIELAFTSAHLHISREGSHRYSAQLDQDYEEGTIAFAFAIEHLGARDLNPVPRAEGPGRQLAFTDAAELLLWCVGPSEEMRRAVVDATSTRGLERVLVSPGFGAPVEGQVPQIVSFGGIGTPYHAHLVPTMSIITGPWSLWAPAFGAEAIDIGLLRAQVVAAADVVRALDAVPRDAIAGGYLADRAARAAGATTGRDVEPPELAP